MPITQLLDEAIELELNMGSLYRIFHHAFPGDADFWWTLNLEEQNHAALLRSGKEYFQPLKRVPDGLLSAPLERIHVLNVKLAELKARFQGTPPSREQAFSLARSLEGSAGEIHFQRFMEKEPESYLDELFQRLNKNDRDHLKRIEQYMEEHEIAPVPPGSNSNISLQIESRGESDGL